MAGGSSCIADVSGGGSGSGWQEEAHVSLMYQVAAVVLDGGRSLCMMYHRCIERRHPALIVLMHILWASDISAHVQVGMRGSDGERAKGGINHRLLYHLVCINRERWAVAP